MWWNGRTYSAHILAHEFWNGKRGKKEVHHTCDNRACVNPDHLCLLKRSKHIELHVLERRKENHYCKAGHLIAEGNRYKNGKFWRCKKCFDDKHRWLVG